MADRDAVVAALRGIIDPETGHDLVTMGLIYEVTVRGSRADVTMTTTTRGCPLSEMLRQGAEAAVLAVPGITEAGVVLTWEPAWTPARIETRALF
ncbi:metal-sulfur cluster assembly factor [Paracoccus sp. (in: a-proteobacteria)]|uniref:metal-sulfur cluster assembly factor n=1 Tax=Paracoccus sp. TaxID=267 RepID=UPI0035B2D2AE